MQRRVFSKLFFLIWVAAGKPVVLGCLTTDGNQRIKKTKTTLLVIESG